MFLAAFFHSGSPICDELSPPLVACFLQVPRYPFAVRRYDSFDCVGSCLFSDMLTFFILVSFRNLAHGYMSDIQVPRLDDFSLRQMLTDLTGLQFSAKASPTVPKYCACWSRWRTWALSKVGVSLMSAEPVHIALFLTELVSTAGERDLGPSTLECVMCSIAWAQVGRFPCLPY